MRSDQSLTRLRRSGRRLSTIAALLALLATVPAPFAAAADEVEDGVLWLLPQYRVPGCRPMPSVPTVFNWLVRKALAIDEFMAASADCGEVGRRGTPQGEGWTYVFWSENQDTATAGLLRRARQKYGLTQLVLKRPGESFSIRASGYEAFFLVQLGGDQGPVRIWSAGDVASLRGSISMADAGGIGVQVESVTFDGERCVSERLLQPGRPGSPRQMLPCL